MNNKLILTAGPSITEKEISYVTDAVTNGWNENWNGYITRFEDEFSKYIGVDNAITTSSCTGALHLGLLALGIGPGDEVIVPEITWVATASAVAYVGATPVFCDIEEGSWCMSVKSAESLITSKTKAIFPVHLYGHPANMPEVMGLANKYNLKVIEDAAPSIGAEVGGQKTGSFGDVAGFSFQGAKIMVTGEGGMLVTNNQSIFDRVKSLGDHGRNPKYPLAAVEVGYKYKMSNLQAALGLAQLEQLDNFIIRKRKMGHLYDNYFNSINCIQIPKTKTKYANNIYWVYGIVLKNECSMNAKEVMQQLSQYGIGTRPFFYPMHLQPVLNKLGLLKKESYPVSENLYLNGFYLPSGLSLTENKINFISETLYKILS